MAMDVIETAAVCRARLDADRAAGRRVGLVPTMGALHAGHTSLIARARTECDVVVVSIFVNPLQFGDPDDIARYPRTIDHDLAACAEAGADVVFVPSVAEMYPSWPEPPATTVSVRGVSDAWEGASRPGHFDGVATVVSKLFSVAGPCRAYFGLKDFQQLAVVRTMAADLCLPVEVVGCPIVREPDGLARSSRNVRLSADERTGALALSRALAAGRAAIAAGARDAAAVRHAMRTVAGAEPLVQLDYAVAVDAATLEEVVTLDDPSAIRLLIAAVVGPVRLIDNAAAGQDADLAPLADQGPARSADMRTSVRRRAEKTVTSENDAHDGADPARQLERIG
jgi:pantoate--beta-alanine ligase